MTDPLARDLTDPAENQAVLDCASALLDGSTSSEDVTRSHGAAIAAEADAAARSRTLLLAAARVPVHLSLAFAMYGETGRMAPRDAHPHGEDFVREKVRQLDRLTAGSRATWSIVAVDDGCPDTPSSAEMMQAIVAAEGYPATGPRAVTVLRLAEVLADGPSVGAAFDALTSPDQSRKGGSILAGLSHAMEAATDGRHIVAYTDADLSANLAQLGALMARILDAEAPALAALGQRYGVPDAVLVMPTGPLTEPESTGGKPGKLIVLFRHAVRATLIPELAHVLDVQAGFKAFDAGALHAALPRMISFDETFDVELLIHLVDEHGAEAVAVEPIVFVEDFAATNFPTGDPGEQHLAMVRQVAGLYERFVAPRHPAQGEGAELLAFVRELDLAAYARLIAGLEAEDPGDATLFDRRWPAAHLRALAAP